MSDDPDAVSAAHVAGIDVLVRRARALALLADLLFVPLELGRAPVVEVAERDADLQLDVGAASLARLVAKVAAPAEEARE